MEEPLSPLPFPRHLDRPAFVALLGVALGLVAFGSSSVLLWSGVLALSGLLLSGLYRLLAKTSSAAGALRVLRSSLPSFAVACFVGAAFGPFAAERTRDRLLFPDETLLCGQRIEILYPVSAHRSSPLQYAALIRQEGREMKVLLRPRDGKKLENGYGVSFLGDLTLSSLTDGTSYHRYLLSEGYWATGFFMPRTEPVRAADPPTGVRLQSLRESVVQDFVRKSAPFLSPDEQGLVVALSLGDRSRLQKADRDDFTNAGLAHIMAVSGYHLGVVFFLLGALLKRLLWPHRVRALRYTLLAIGLLLYTLLTGAATATVRALVMSTLILLGKTMGRRTDAVQLMSLTLLLFLLFEPLSFLSVGLVLSLGAVWGILSFLPLFQRLFRPSFRVLGWFRDAFFVTLSAQIALLPLLFFYFSKLQLSVFWSNIPLVLLSAVLIPYGLFAVFLSSLLGGVVPGLLYPPLGELASWMLGLTHFFGGDGNALTVQGDWSLFMVIAYYAALVIVQKLAVSLLNRRLSYPA
ncbi:MAG: ComEC/Rec2 family competence protein [Bacteroidales bacterium]|nr:ComEC/Rec2 family competence protein [Bacteroidales bacterium]